MHPRANGGDHASHDQARTVSRKPPMRIGLIAPPFIEIPPKRYGGTELFIANLARELHGRGHDLTVYANGQSSLPCPVKWFYRRGDWPPTDPVRMQLTNADHTAWAIHDASASSDLLHLNDPVAVPFTRFVDVPAVLTVHHPHEPVFTEHYMNHPRIHYVAIGRWLARREPMPNVHVVHHGIHLPDYTFSAEKDEYVAFLGRMAPCKGPHLAIAAARLARVHLKLAGEIQPTYREYWEREVCPAIDGRQIEYVGEADLATKNKLLSRARALLFPIQWEEPFGLVMIEALACGTPVLAFPGGSVAEIVRDGVNGWVCHDVAEMAAHIVASGISPVDCREFVARHFSAARMADQYVEVYQRALHSSVQAGPATGTNGRSHSDAGSTSPACHLRPSRSGEELS
jgi:glycosyltransferase involved in cell wall biosynthesis